MGFIGYGGWNLWKIERAQDKLKKSLGAESCDDLCTQCEWCDTCIDGVCENVEEEWGRESADFNHLCRQCHDEHIEELGMNAEDYTEIGICDYGLVCDQNIPTPLNEYGICQDCQEQWEYENEMNAESRDELIETLIGIRQKLARQEGIEDWENDSEGPLDSLSSAFIQELIWYLDGDRDTWDAESFGAEDMDGRVVNIVGVENKVYVTIRFPDTNEHYGYDKIFVGEMEDVMLAESFGADSLEDCKKRLGIAEEVLSMSDAVQTYNKYLLQDMGIDRYADDDDDLAYCPRCGLNPNYHQPLEQHGS